MNIGIKNETITEEDAVQKALGNSLEEEQLLEYAVLRHVAQKQFSSLIVVDAKTGRAKEWIPQPAEDGKKFIDIQNLDTNSEKFLRRYAHEENLDVVIRETRLMAVVEKLESEDSYSVIYEGENTQGEHCFFKLEFTYMNREEGIICCTNEDVTISIIRSKNHEEMIKMGFEREAKFNDAQTLFLSNMSHQIRTPLNAIVGMAEIAKLDINNPKKVTECMDIILKSSKTLVSVVSDILDSSLQTGSVKLLPVPTSVHELVEQAKDDFTSSYKKEGQEFVIDVDVTHDRAMLDADRTLRVIINLLYNAAKFSPKNSKIEMRIRELPGEKPNEGFYKLEVIDQGKGIRKEDMEHIFEPFYRDKDSANNYVPGTGLGLSVVKSILQAKGATIDIESEPGKGTKVTIIDPVTFITEKKRSVAEGEQVLKGRRVLLAEDQPINMLVAKRMLERFGATVDTAEHGKYAYEQYMNHPAGTYDIIFMDIQMPIMNGYDATRKIRAAGREDSETVKIVSMTANVMSEDIEEAERTGMNAYIGKPIRTEELQQMIIDLLEL